MDRRKFLGSLALLGLQGVMLDAAGPAALDGLDSGPTVLPAGRRKKKPDFDENLVAIISDLHVNPGGYQPSRLERTVADILALRPRPRNVIALGDLAYLTGKPSEYALLKQILAPFEGTGIRLTMTMGNHDRRGNFAEAFPEYASASLMEDRFVYVVETPRADIILLDSLQESEDPNAWITPGALPDNEKEWLRTTLASYTDKPVLVTAHHPIEEIGIKDILLSSPTCCGFIHGHDHVWRDGWFKKSYGERDLLRTLCLPSTGHWGDIGYTMLHLEDGYAEADLCEYEFFFPHPLEEGEAKPAQWTMIEEERKNASVRFVYRK